MLGANIGAELLIILTAVPQVYIHFNKPEQRALSAVTLDEIEKLAAEGHFPPGSMGPKVDAAVHFLIEVQVDGPDRLGTQIGHSLHRDQVTLPDDPDSIRHSLHFGERVAGEKHRTTVCRHLAHHSLEFALHEGIET